MRTAWTRIDGMHRSRKIRKALQARVADPLWTLGRQWQFGEFKGDDAASPVKVRMESVSYDVNHITLYDDASQKVIKTRAIRNNELLEPVIEREVITEDSLISVRIKAEAGVQFIRMMPKTRQDKVQDILKTSFPFKDLSYEFAGREKFLKLLIAKSFDASLFAKTNKNKRNALAQEIGVNTDSFERLFQSWLTYYQNRFSEPQQNDSTWKKDRLEYSFGVSSENPRAKVHLKLKAKEYHGGRVDWHQFDLDAENSTGIERKLRNSKTSWLIPTPIRYAGMPSDRFWDFEDGKVFFGGISATETDISQILLSEFATVYSNDWYMLPLTVNTGSLTRIAGMSVYDSFGDRHLIESTARRDHVNKINDWKFFEMSGDTSTSHKLSPWLYVPRTVLGGYEDKPVERVVFTRDEMANIAWGIEETIESVSGHRFSRRTSWMKHKDQVTAAVREQDNKDSSSKNNGEKDTWVYRLLNYVPPYWVPFTPEIKNNKVTNNLVRGRMGEWDLLGDLKPLLAGGKGKILQPDAPMSLQEEEIPRGAIEVTRSYQAARDVDGNLIVWAGRRKRPASGDRSSGRETDMIEKKERVNE